MLFGCSESRGEPAFNTAQATAGPWTICRRYQSGMFGSTFAADSSGCGNDIGKRATFYSAKPNLASMASGALDAATLAWLNSVDDSHILFVTIWHEPDIKLRGGSFTSTDVTNWHAAQNQFVSLVRSLAKPHVYVGTCLSSYPSLFGGAGQPTQFEVAGIDFIGWDSYLYSNTATTGAHEWASIVAYCEKLGVAYGVGEFGLNGAVSNLSTGTTWLGTQATYLASHGTTRHPGSAAFVCLFDANVGGEIAIPSDNALFPPACASIATANFLPYTKFVL